MFSETRATIVTICASAAANGDEQGKERDRVGSRNGIFQFIGDEKEKSQLKPSH